MAATKVLWDPMQTPKGEGYQNWQELGSFIEDRMRGQGKRELRRIVGTLIRLLLDRKVLSSKDLIDLFPQLEPGRCYIVFHRD